MAEPASKRSSGHYFDAEPVEPVGAEGGPARPSRPVAHAASPTAACSRPTGSTRARSTSCSTGRRRPRPGTFVDLGCGYGPIACALARRSPGGHGVGRRRERAGPRAVPGQRRAARARQRPRRHRRRRAGRPGRRRAVVEPADPHRQGRAARAARRRGSAGSRPTGAALLVVQKHLGADSLHRWLEAEGWAVERLGSRAGYRLLEVRPRVKQLDGTGMKRLHREWRRRTEGRLGARARRRAGPVQRRRHHPHRRGPPGRRRVAGRAHARPRRRQGGQDRARHPALPHLPPRRHHGRRHRRRHGRPATGSSASSWPTAPARCTSSTARTGDLPRRRARGPRVQPGHARRPATRSPSSRCSARSGRSTWPRPRPSRCTSCAASSGRDPAGLTTPDAPVGAADLASAAMVEPVVRTLRDDELVDAARIVNRAMLGSVTDEVNEGWASLIDAERALGAFSADRRAGRPRPRLRRRPLRARGRRRPRRRRHRGRRRSPTTGARATSPGSWRRSSRAMAERGTAVGLLVAAEWPIYGRFGYGPAIDACGFDIDTRTARFLAEPIGSIEVVMPDGAAARARAGARAAAPAHPGRDHPRRPRCGTRSPGVRGWPGQPARRRARSAARCGATRRARSRARSPTRSTTTGSGTGRPARPRSRCSSAPPPRPSASSGATSARSTGSPPSRPATAASTTRSR